MKRSIYFVTFFVFIFLSSALYAQEKEVPKERQHEMETSGVKELDAFHELLHPLVHEAFPKRDFDTIRKALPKLVESGMRLKIAVLPDELASNRKAFSIEAKKLLKQLTEMNKKKAKLSDDQLGEKFTQMHETFEKLMDMTQ